MTYCDDVENGKSAQPVRRLRAFSMSKPFQSEPQVRIELTTARLRIGCSTPELLWQVLANGPSTGGVAVKAPPCATLYSQRHWHLKRRAVPRVPWSGLEPLCLSAPPPQDGVSTNFTTRAFAAARVTDCEPVQKTTGPTGLEPATSRVTVECSNQTELRPQLLKSGSETLSSLHTCLVTGLVVSQPVEIAP